MRPPDAKPPKSSVSTSFGLYILRFELFFAWESVEKHWS